ncbi:MAG: hypothetical protein HY016_12690 [Nitrosomonadales bacterium]|nr:hypothetical protein [Nitrosomonadales bacterium]
MSSSPPLARLRRFSPWLWILAGTLVAMGAYLQALNYPFIYDDVVYITENAKLSGLHPTELWRLFVEPYNSYAEFLPLRELSYWVDIALFGLNPAAFRADNIILYLLCLPPVYFITSGLWKYFRPSDAAGAPWVAAIVTALFVVHPAHVETVVWISGRKDVLATLLSLLALWLAIVARREQGLSVPHAAATLLALLAAMLAKASAFAVAPVIALLWLMFWRDVPAPYRRRSVLLWPLASLLLAACIALVFATTIASKLPFYFGIEVITRSLAVLGWLFRLSVSTESRHFFYPTFDDPYLPLMVGLGGVVLAAAAASVFSLLRKRQSLEAFSIIVFLLLCIPSIQLIPYSPPSLVSDRWLSLALWPVMLLLVTLAWRLKPVVRMVLLLIFALSWCWQTVERPRDWRSFEAMIDADIRAYPGYYMPAVYKIFAVQLRQGLRGDALETANGIANPEFRNAMIGMIKGDHAAHVSAATEGQIQEAMNLLWQLESDIERLPLQAKWDPLVYHVWEKRRVVLKSDWDYLARQFPGDVAVRYNVGLWMLKIHNQGAVAHLRFALDSQRLPEPVRGTAFKNYGLALMEGGNFAEAETPLRAALEQSPPDFRAYCLLAGVYRQTGRAEAAAGAAAECSSRVRAE